MTGRRVTVHGTPVRLPGRAERRACRGLSLAQVLADGDAEHDAGCHGGGCDGRCAERAYARWSAAGWK